MARIKDCQGHGPDLTLRAMVITKDLTFKAMARTKDLTLEATAQT